MQVSKNTKLIIGNWKENPENLEIAEQLLEITKNFSEKISEKFFLAHAVPNIFVGFLMQKNSENSQNIILQNISCFEGGSHTGEISAMQAKNLGIKASIVGHSETRLSPQNPRGDEDTQVNLKIKNLFAQEMSVILCVGEFIRSDDSNKKDDYKKYIATQLQNCLQGFNEKDFEKLVIAYEPIWAIGKDAKRAATNEEIVETISFIKSTTHPRGSLVKVLYGGSVDENNAKEILNLENVDGILVGRASSDPEKWQKLLQNIS